MANKDPSGGAPVAGVAGLESLAALVDAMENVDKSTKAGTKNFKIMNERLQRLDKDTKRTSSGFDVLSKVMRGGVKTGMLDATATAKVMAATLSKESDVMTNTYAGAMKAQLHAVELAEKEMKKQGETGRRDAAILGTQRHHLEVEMFKESMRFREAEAKAIQTSGGPVNFFTGAFKGMSAAMMRHGASAAEAVGSTFGMTAGTMAKMASGIGAVVLVFSALAFVMKHVSKEAKEAMAAGVSTAATYGEAIHQGRVYAEVLLETALASGLTTEKLQELQVAVFKAGGLSRGFGLQFSADMANIGIMFGLTADEAVDMSVKMGVASKNTQERTMKMFGAFGLEAQRLHVPLDMLLDPMMQLAEISAHAAAGTENAAISLMMMDEAVATLGKSQLNIFKGMAGVDIAKFSKQFTGMIASIDDVSLAAMTFNRGQSFDQMIEGVANMGFKGRVAAIGEMMNRFHFKGETTGEKYRLGLALGANPNDFQSAVGLGGTAAAAVKGGVSDEKFKQSLIAKADRELADRKTAGAFLTAGEDPMNAIKLMLGKILEIVIKWSSTPFFGVDSEELKKIAEGGSTKMEIVKAANGANGYGAASVNRVRNQMGR